jgi:uncharacterized protein (DUF1684 family)
MISAYLRHASLSVLFAFAAAATAAPADDYAKELAAWRANAEARLRNEHGWLAIAGRWELKDGANTIGSAPGNDVVLPKELAPAKLGTVRVTKAGATLTLAPGVKMWTEPAAGRREMEFTEHTLVTRGSPDWVGAGRLSMYVFTREDGRSILRIADRESPNRKRFAGRVWYDGKPAMRVPAKFVAYPKGTKIPIANVMGEIHEEDAGGYVEFQLAGATHRLDAFVDDDDGSLFIIMRDGTSGAGTYPPGRFVTAAKPVDGKVDLDFNKAYNPPCAFSAYTTCPLPPPQNWLKASVDAGEKYVPVRK